jgi:hypothetical protein
VYVHVFLTHCLNRQTLLRTLKDLQSIHSVLQKKNQPLSIFMDTYSEELAFSNIFMGSSRPENHEVKIQYSEIVKSELRRSDRRVARCVDNIFFKLKKVQMQAVTGQVNVAVCKKKNRWQNYDSWSVERPRRY